MAKGAAGNGFDSLGILVALHEQMSGLAPSLRQLVQSDGNQSDLSQSQARQKTAVTLAVNYYLSWSYEVLIGNVTCLPSSGSNNAHLTQNATNAAAPATLKGGQRPQSPCWCGPFYGARRHGQCRATDG